MAEPAPRDWNYLFDRLLSRQGDVSSPVSGPPPRRPRAARAEPPTDAAGHEEFVLQQTPRTRELELQLERTIKRADRLIRNFQDRQTELEELVAGDARAVKDALSRAKELTERLGSELGALRSRSEAAFEEFEGRSAALLEAYAVAARSAEAAAGRADAQLQAFDRGISQLVSTASREIREAADAVRRSQEPQQPHAVRPAARVHSGGSTESVWRTPVRRPLLAVLVLGLLPLALFGTYVQRQVAAANERAADAERSAADARKLAEGRAAAATENAERAAAGALEVAGRAGRMMDIMTAPDARRLELLGGRGAPAASGQALWSRSRGVIVSGTRVPPAPPGQVLQVWVRTSAGVVSLGFVEPDGQGRLAAAFDLPPDLTGAVWGYQVTSEPQGGSAAPAGPIVLSN